MNYTTLAAVLVAALVVTTGAVAAQPGNAGASNDGTDAGPPGTLPGPVPDFVGDIHSAIQSFLDGSMDGSLGKTISDIAGGNANAASTH